MYKCVHLHNILSYHLVHVEFLQLHFPHQGTLELVMGACHILHVQFLVDRIEIS